MNADIVLFYLAVGGVSELLIMRYPTPGERVGMMVALFSTAFFLGAAVPVTHNQVAMLCLFAARFGTVLGKVVGGAVDVYRLRQAKREWENGRTVQTGRAKGERV